MTEENQRRVRILRVRKDLLAELLLLPPGTKILGTSDQVYFSTGDIAIKVEGPDFTPVEPGCVIPEATATYTAIMTPKFNGWDQR